MFVLYYFESNYDGGDFEIIKCSKDRAKLQQLRDKIQEVNNSRATVQQNYMKALQDFSKKQAEGLAGWLEENIESILEYEQGYKYGKWGNTGGRFFGDAHNERNYPDWHTGPDKPYHPSSILKDRMEFIEDVRKYNRHYNEIEKRLDHSKIKTPYKRVKFDIQAPKEYPQYNTDLQIMEIDEI